MFCTVLLAADVANAAVLGSLAFKDRVGVVSSTDSIDVWLTLALDPLSDPIVTDANRLVLSGADMSEFSSVEDSYVNISFTCSGSFTASCITGPPYSFSFFMGPGSMVFPRDLNVQPGQTVDFLFGTFKPTNGAPVPAGTYRFYSANLFISAEGLDQSGAPLSKDFPLFSTCATGDNTCAFERTVIEQQQVVPEPASMLLLVPTMIAGGILRRRRR